MEQLAAFLNDLIDRADNFPPGPAKEFFILVALLIFQAMLLFGSIERRNLVPVNRANKNRMIESFSDEECWHNLRFRKAELRQLFLLSNFPQLVRCDNGVKCQGEYAFCLMLYRLAYPCRFFNLQEIFGREFTQLSRIFKFAINFMYESHRHKVQGNLDWYKDRFALYHNAVIRRIRMSRHNHNIGFMPEELSDIFAFLDGTGLEIARPGNGAQNPFYNGYMHGHFLIFQGISFPDGMVVIEGAFPGYQQDIMIWRDSAMRIELEAIMIERLHQGLPRLKLCADKIYSNSILVTAAYSLRNNRDGLQDWQINFNRIMSDIRVGVEWSFGKIVTRNKYVSFGKSMQIQGSPVSQYYHVAVLLANAHTCSYGCMQTTYFDLAAPSLENYFQQEE